MFQIQDFNPEPRWGSATQREKFNSNIWDIRHKLSEAKQQDRSIFFKAEQLYKITKIPQKLIRELIQDKVIMPYENGFVVNNKQVFCRVCAKEDFNESRSHYTTRHDPWKPNYHKFRMYEYEVTKHLHDDHWINRDRDTKTGEYRRPLTDAILEEFITETEPSFEVKQHRFVFKKIDNSGYDRLYMEIECKDCGYSRNICEDVSPCTKGTN